MPTAVAIYDNSTDLQRALDRLHEAGFGEDSIRVIGQGDATTAGTDESRTGEAGAGFGDNADEGLAGMAAAGGLGRGTTAGGAARGPLPRRAARAARRYSWAPPEALSIRFRALISARTRRGFLAKASARRVANCSPLPPLVRTPLEFTISFARQEQASQTTPTGASALRAAA